MANNQSNSKKQMCVSCTYEEATSTDGTLPLCPACAALAEMNRRGVTRPKKQSSSLALSLLN
jgi:predicted RNA-binding Zn-ribbon protein involved in translation (DUF1610 family)